MTSVDGRITMSTITATVARAAKVGRIEAQNRRYSGANTIARTVPHNTAP